MTPEEILRGAADLLEDKGWCQGMNRDPMGRLCLGEALMTAAAMPVAPIVAVSTEFQRAHRALTHELEQADLVKWNDTPGRTKEEVIAALRNSKRWL